MKVKTSIALEQSVLDKLRERAKRERRSVSSLLDFEIHRMLESDVREVSVLRETDQEAGQ